MSEEVSVGEISVTPTNPRDQITQAANATPRGYLKSLERDRAKPRARQEANFPRYTMTPLITPDYRSNYFARFCENATETLTLAHFFRPSDIGFRWSRALALKGKKMKVLAGNQLRNVTFENGKYRMSYFALNHHSLADGAVVTSFELGRISALRVIAEIEGRDDPYPEGDDEQDGAGEES